MSTLRTNEVEMLDGLGKGAITFDSIAEMQDSSSIKVGQKVRTLGYYATGDGGGNDYEIVAAGTGTDDGGSFIDLSGSGLQAKGLFLNGVNIKQFGSVADGATDNRVNIQSAIDFASQQGYPLYATKGDYRLSDYLSISSPIKVYGDGEARLIFSKGGDYSVGGAINPLDVTGIEFNNISFDSEEDTILSSIIHFRGCSEVRVENCRFSATLLPDGSKSITVQHNDDTPSSTVENVTISNNRCIEAPNVCLIIGSFAQPPTNITIDSNIYVGRNLGSGGAIKIDKMVNNCVISNNAINGMDFAEEGITVEQGSYHVTVIGNSITKIVEYGIKFADDSGNAGGIAFDDVLIANNHVYGMSSNPGQGIRLISEANQSSNITISGNVVSNCISGLFDSDGNITNLAVIGNTFNDIETVGINVKSSGCVIEGNTVRGGGTSNYSALFASTGQSKVKNNIFEKNNGASSTDIANGSPHSSDMIVYGNDGLKANSERAISTTTELAPGIALTELYSSGGAINATLPDGIQEGQIKTIHHSAVGTLNGATVTVTNHETSSPEVITFSGRNDTAVLMWMGNHWITLKLSGATV